MNLFTKKSQLLGQNLNKGPDGKDTPACCPDDVFLDGASLNGNDLVLTMNNGGTYTVDLSSLIPAPGIASIPIGNTLFVSADGDDATGTRERFDLPYRTPWAAIADSLNGDTVVVYPGTYTLSGASDDGLQRIVKSGVRMFMYPNALIVAAADATSNILSDDGNALNGSIHGYGEIRLLNQLGETLTNANSTFTLQLRKLIGPISAVNFTKFEVQLEEHLTIGDNVCVSMYPNAICSFLFSYYSKYTVLSGNVNEASFAIDGSGQNIAGSVDIQIEKLVLNGGDIYESFYFAGIAQTGSVSLKVSDMNDNGALSSLHLIGVGVFATRSIFNVDICGTTKKGLIYQAIPGFAATGVFKVRMTKQKSNEPEFYFANISAGCHFRFELDLVIYQVAGEEVLNEGLIFAYGTFNPGMTFSGKVNARETYLIATTGATLGYFANLANLLFDGDAPTWNEPNTTTIPIDINILNCYSNIPTDMTDLNMLGDVMNHVPTLLL